MQLSLIIPNYNNQKYLKQCIESVLIQTRKPDEIIIADDVSSDRSIKIIKYYEKKYKFIRGIYNKKNMGVSLNRHNAILSSKYDYITTLDSDDFFYDNKKLENEMKLIEKHKKKFNKEIISYSNIIFVNEDGDRIKKIYFNNNDYTNGNLFENIIMRKSYFIPRDFIFLKQQYLKISGYRSSLPIYEDWDLKIRLSSKFRFYYTGEDGVAHRVHNKGLSSVFIGKHFYYLNKIFKSNIHLLQPKKYYIAYAFFAIYLFKRILGLIKNESSKIIK